MWMIFILILNVFANDLTQLNLDDLGFSTQHTKPDEQKLKMFNERSSKLQTHQVLGLTTWALMAATMLTTPGNRKTSDAHKYLGLATSALYFTTAYYGLSSPNVDKDLKNESMNIKIHKALAWIHFPLMILMPITGIIAERQIKKDGHSHGIGDYMSKLGGLTFLSYTGAMAVMVFDF